MDYIVSWYSSCFFLLPCFCSSCVQNNDEICIQIGLCGSTKVEAVGRVSLAAKPQAPKVFELMLYIASVCLSSIKDSG